MHLYIIDFLDRRFTENLVFELVTISDNNFTFRKHDNFLSCRENLRRFK